MILWLWLLLAAQAAPEPFYEDQGHTMRLRLKALNERSLRQLVNQESEGRVKLYFRQEADGSRVRVKLNQLDVPELIGILTALVANNPGAEMDMILEGFDRARVPVTVWWDEARELVVRRGSVVVSKVDWTTTAASLKTKYGIADVVNRDRIWEPQALQLVDQALSMLTADELAMMRDVPFHRVSAPNAEQKRRLGRGEGDDPVAIYTQDRKGPRIELYDGALLPPRRFVGSPDSPYPLAFHVLLHEMGHAVSRRDHRQIYMRDLQLVTEHNKITESINVLGEAYTARANAYRRRPSKSEAAALASEFAWLEAKKSAADQIAALIDDSRAQLKKLEVSQAALGLRRALKGKPAPTRYGRTSLEEAFAECFALYHDDPAALLRARPVVHAWFAAGGHLAGSKSAH